MSGPKTSKYTLTPEQRQRLKEQRQVMRQTRAAQDKRNAILYKVKHKVKAFQSMIPELEILWRETGKGAAELRELKEFFYEVTAKVNDKLYQADGFPLARLREQIAELNGIGSQIKENQVKLDKTIRQIRSEHQSELEQTIAAGFEMDFSCLGTERKNQSNPYIERISVELEKISHMDLPDFLEERLADLRKKASAVTGTDYLENFYAMQVSPFVHECQQYMESGEEYEELLAQYGMLANELGEKQKAYVFSKQAVEELRKDIARLEKTLMRAREQEYISAAVDEALCEIGYELVGARTVVKRSGKRFKNGLYCIEEGNAVNVTFSDNGQISMELGVLDVVDRAPDEEEAEDLEDAMRAFCADYKKLEARLAKKGILINHMSLLPPAAEYAQVINTSDYVMKEGVMEGLQDPGKEKNHSVSNQQAFREG